MTAKDRLSIFSRPFEKAYLPEDVPKPHLSHRLTHIGASVIDRVLILRRRGVAPPRS